MKVRIKFLGGPLDAQEGDTERLEELKLFFHERERSVYAYCRNNELDYFYDHKRSTELTGIYDEAKAKFVAEQQKQSVEFSDTPIREGEDEDATEDPENRID